jgi:ribosome-associated protein
MSDAYIVELEEQPIELCNLLKLLNLVESGGQAKMLIAEGYVGLNGELCLQKRKKVFAGDTVEFDGQLYQIAQLDNTSAVDADDSQPEQALVLPTEKVEEHQVKPSNPAQKQAHKGNKKQPSKDKKTGRRPISFG